MDEQALQNYYGAGFGVGAAAATNPNEKLRREKKGV